MQESNKIFTGLRRIDIPTRGFKPGQLIVVGSKTWGPELPAFIELNPFALDCALYATRNQGISTIFFSLGMSTNQLVKHTRLKDLQIPENLIIDDTPSLLAADFEMKLKKSVEEHGVRLAIIDEVDLMERYWDANNDKWIFKPWERKDFVGGFLKECAEKYGVTVIINAYILSSGRFMWPNLVSQSDVVIEIEDNVPNVKKRAKLRIPLKEDGCLDIEAINGLPIEDKKDVIASFSREQYNEYLKSLPLDESNEPIKPIKVDYTLEEALEWGMFVDAKEVIDNIGKKYRK